jgi:hypothetical protein
MSESMGELFRLDMMHTSLSLDAEERDRQASAKPSLAGAPNAAVRRLTNMKILNEGNKQVAGWWHGLVMTCPNCSRQVELEAVDQHSAWWMHAGPHAVSVTCEMCGDIMHAKSPNAVAHRKPPPTQEDSNAK